MFYFFEFPFRVSHSDREISEWNSQKSYRQDNSCHRDLDPHVSKSNMLVFLSVMTHFIVALFSFQSNSHCFETFLKTVMTHFIVALFSFQSNSHCFETFLKDKKQIEEFHSITFDEIYRTT